MQKFAEVGNPRRVISESCFRVLSLQFETQNEVDVIKPILEELEVLRLSCVLGALPSANPADFDDETLEAKQFDDDFARFLRSDVFGNGARDASAGGGPGSVCVIGLFGKQEQVKQEIRNLGGWDEAMETKLRKRDLGMYAIVLPQADEGNSTTTGIKMVALFPWLLDEYFHPDRLRETPAYLLRLLTGLTNSITCCLSGEDERQMKEFMQTENDDGEGGAEGWRAYSAAFHVEQQLDAKDDIRSTLTQMLPFPHGLKSASKVGIVKGSFAALMGVTQAAPEKKLKPEYKRQFPNAAQFCDWVKEHSSKVDLYLSSDGWSKDMARTFLTREGEWPSGQLAHLEESKNKISELAEASCRRDLMPKWTQIQAKLLEIGDDVFSIDNLLQERQLSSATVRFIENSIADLTCSSPVVQRGDSIKILKLPVRLPNLMKHFIELFNKGDETQLNFVLQQAHLKNLKEMAGQERGSIIGRLASWAFSPFSSSSQDAFRERMLDLLETMKQIWQSEVRRVYDAHSEHVVRRSIPTKERELHESLDKERIAIIERVLSRQLQTLSQSGKRGIRADVMVRSHPANGIMCLVREEGILPRRDQLHLWSLSNGPNGSADRHVIELGQVDLVRGERLLKVFTLQSRSILLLSSTAEKTFVRRVEFNTRNWNSRGNQFVSIRELSRTTAVCDYYNKERLLVIGDPNGKVGVYRLNEKFTGMEPVRTLDMTLKTSLEMPLQDIVLSDGILYMVDYTGAMQSLNTRNQQASRKKVVGFGPPSQGSHLVRALDGAVLGWLEQDKSKMKFIAAEDMREIPQSTCVGLPKSRSTPLVCEVFEDVLFVVDYDAGEIRANKLEVSLKSESYRIESSAGALSSDDQDETSARNIISAHWLWTFYHVYEKFPVRGELFRYSSDCIRHSLSLTLVCDVKNTSDSSLLDEGFQKLLEMIMEKLRLLNKPLFGLDLTAKQVAVHCAQYDRTSLWEDNVKVVSPQSITVLVRELVTFVPMQICRAEFNTLTLMSDGQQAPYNEVGGDGNAKALSSADIALKLRFGLLSPLIASWNRQCIVVTSMGKQSTGKSYFLNHLTGSSFATSGARCTDGAWMSVRFLPNGMMLVVIDFEGLGSFERTEQEDVFLSVLNASVSMLTIFRMEMRLDKEIDELFSKFQKGSQLIKNDPQLFRGKLYMSVKDVNPNDQRGVVGEFVSKFQRLLAANKEQNFLTDMYRGQLAINCSPPLGTMGYYQSLAEAQKTISKDLASNPQAGFASGKTFLDCIRLLLAKISILGWTSLDESAIRMKIAQVVKKLPGVLRYGCITDDSTDDITKKHPQHAVSRDKLVLVSGRPVIASFDEVCAKNPSLAKKWRQLASLIPLDQIDDEDIDLGPCVDAATTNRVEAASKGISLMYDLFIQLIRQTSASQVANKSLQHKFDDFLSFAVRRRCLRVQMWSRSIVGERVPEVWNATEQQALGTLQTLFVRCLDCCTECRLGCMKVSAHAASGDAVHDCGTNHVCAGVCGYCGDSEADEDETPHCSKPAGHEGRCECDRGDHTCGKPCRLEHASNCGKFCGKKAGHDDADDHRCSVGLHKCGQSCPAQNCSRHCVQDVEVPHTVHKCEVDRCLATCVMDGCSRSCSSTDHFHGHIEAKIAFDVENPDIAAKNGDTFDAFSEKPIIHICEHSHVCQDLCVEDGICHIDVTLKQSSKTFVGARGTFQYTFQEMNGSRKKCARKLDPGQTSHTGKHSCTGVVIESDDEENSDDEMKGAALFRDQVIHYCDVRCPCCSYYCQREHGHEGLHKTTHGNMRNTMFLSEDHEIDLMDRKYAAGDRGTAEMCNLYCSKMGRGHVHFLDCEKQKASDPCVYTGSQEDKRRHCTRVLEPTPPHEQDEVLHERFWDTLGWEDPCASVQEREEFGKCPYKCDAPDHEDKETSYCVLPAWHPPAVEPAGGPDGFSYVGDHKFECSHVTTGNKVHHIFVLDASGSMQGSPWDRLNGAFREYVHNRVNAGSILDLVTVITFDSSASIVWEAADITQMKTATAPFRGGGTSFGVALRLANEVLSRVAFDTYKPVVVFFSDGHPCDGQQGEQMASHIAQSYAKYGLEAYAVGFGSVNHSVLERIAVELGGSYRQVLTGDELKQTFQSISASIGTRAGLALTKPFHEMICVICQKELSGEATSVLMPCQHELHQRCLRRLVESTGDGQAKLCPTCRREIQA